MERKQQVNLEGQHKQVTLSMPMESQSTVGNGRTKAPWPGKPIDDATTESPKYKFTS